MPKGELSEDFLSFEEKQRFFIKFKRKETKLSKMKLKSTTNKQFLTYVLQNEVSETITVKLWTFFGYLLDIDESVWREQLPGIDSFFPNPAKVWKPDIIILNK